MRSGSAGCRVKPRIGMTVYYFQLEITDDLKPPDDPEPTLPYLIPLPALITGLGTRNEGGGGETAIAFLTVFPALEGQGISFPCGQVIAEYSSTPEPGKWSFLDDDPSAGFE